MYYFTKFSKYTSSHNIIINILFAAFLNTLGTGCVYFGPGEIKAGASVKPEILYWGGKRENKAGMNMMCCPPLYNQPGGDTAKWHNGIIRTRYRKRKFIFQASSYWVCHGFSHPSRILSLFSDCNKCLLRNWGLKSHAWILKWWAGSPKAGSSWKIWGPFRSQASIQTLASTCGFAEQEQLLAVWFNSTVRKKWSEQKKVHRTISEVCRIWIFPFTKSFFKY